MLHTQPGNLDALQALVASGQRYACLYAEPPWRYTNQATRGAADKEYPTLTLEDIAALPVEALALPKAHLHLWVSPWYEGRGDGNVEIIIISYHFSSLKSDCSTPVLRARGSSGICRSR